MEEENIKLKELDLSNFKMIANFSERHFHDRVKIRNSIPKSKIEEKIKELEHIRDTALTFVGAEIMEHKIHILKLILEESEENK